MDQYSMRSQYVILFIISGCLLGCSKEETEYPSPDPYIYQIVSGIEPDSLYQTVLWLQRMQTRFYLAENHREVAQRLLERFDLLDLLETRLDSFLLVSDCDGTHYSTWQYNVVAALAGSEGAGPLCIVGAHYDCIVEDGDPFLFAPGADDNGSGVAAVLEMARLMAQLELSPKTPVQFVLFAAEENNLDGSADYARKLSNWGTSVRMMLNNDMIGYSPGSDPSSWTVNIMDYYNSASFPDDAARVCAQYTSLKSICDNRYSDEGDSYSFAEEGIPSLFFISAEENPDYHSENDLIDHCNFTYCGEVAKISFALLIEHAVK